MENLLSLSRRGRGGRKRSASPTHSVAQDLSVASQPKPISQGIP